MDDLGYGRAPEIGDRMRALNKHAQSIAARVAIGLLVQKDPRSWRIESAEQLLNKEYPMCLGAVQLALNTHLDLQNKWLSIVKVTPPDLDQWLDFAKANSPDPDSEPQEPQND